MDLDRLFWMKGTNNSLFFTNGAGSRDNQSAFTFPQPYINCYSRVKSEVMKRTIKSFQIKSKHFEQS